jgi:hypothetical protein
MQGTCDELLASARFAGDEHRRAGLRQASDRPEYILHRRRLAEVDALAAWLARRISASAWSTSNGFGRYSNAPPWNDATALSRSEYAVITMTGI